MIDAFRDQNAGLLLTQRISVAISNGNTISVLGMLPAGDDMKELKLKFKIEVGYLRSLMYTIIMSIIFKSFVSCLVGSTRHVAISTSSVK